MPNLKIIHTVIGKNENFTKQLVRRSYNMHHLRTIPENEYRSILKAYDDFLILKGVETPKLHSNEIASRFYVITRGQIALTSELIQYALTEQSNRIIVSLESLIKAAHVLLGKDNSIFSDHNSIVQKLLKEVNREVA